LMAARDGRLIGQIPVEQAPIGEVRQPTHFDASFFGSSEASWGLNCRS
jgi:hypothetical protein